MCLDIKVNGRSNNNNNKIIVIIIVMQYLYITQIQKLVRCWVVTRWLFDKMPFKGILRGELPDVGWNRIPY